MDEDIVNGVVLDVKHNLEEAREYLLQMRSGYPEIMRQVD